MKVQNIKDIVAWINGGAILLTIHLDHKPGFITLKTVLAIDLFLSSLFYIINILYQIKKDNNMLLHPVGTIGNVILFALVIHRIWTTLPITIFVSISIILVNLEMIYLKIKYEKKRNIIIKWSGLIFMSLLSVVALYDILERSGYW